jgi:hypothetical protein
LFEPIRFISILFFSAAGSRDMVPSDFPETAAGSPFVRDGDSFSKEGSTGSASVIPYQGNRFISCK